MTLYLKLEVINRERHILEVEKKDIETRLDELEKLEDDVTRKHAATTKRNKELGVARKLNDALIRNNFNAEDILINNKPLIDDMIEIHGEEWNLQKYIDRYKKILAQ